uniref:Uncharacterized protein LOC104236807 n=1 Tax=Nicotiana sylvestris TaxID=4096 RepID=A0A1U7XAK1_NICSY|nr:PREDICTED: uncharacterized protein LOC104236807 [Nicotiana sylvestris]
MLLYFIHLRISWWRVQNVALFHSLKNVIHVRFIHILEKLPSMSLRSSASSRLSQARLPDLNSMLKNLWNPSYDREMNLDREATRSVSFCTCFLLINTSSIPSMALI